MIVTIRAKVTRKKGNDGRGSYRLKRYIKELNSHEVEAGIFKEAGIHPSAKNSERWSYATLMAFHELQVDFTSRRPIFKEASKGLLKTLSKDLMSSFIRGAGKAVERGSVNATPLFDEAGMCMAEAIREIFGKSPPLAPNRPSTIRSKKSSKPMIEHGSLLSAVSYRNTKNREIKK